MNVCVCVLGVLEGLGKNEVRARVSRRKTLKYDLYIHVHVHK